MFQPKSTVATRTWPLSGAISARASRCREIPIFVAGGVGELHAHLGRQEAALAVHADTGAAERLAAAIAVTDTAAPIGAV